LIIEELTKGPKRWRDLAELTKDHRWSRYMMRARSSEKGKQTAPIKQGSYFDLKRYLDDLIEKGNIVRKKLSHKKVVYMLREDAEILDKTWTVLKQKEADMPLVLEEIRKLKTELTPEQAKNWIAALMFLGLENFLDGLEHAVRAEEKWGSYARWILDHFIDTFGTTLLMCGKTYPDLMDSAIELVKHNLESLSLSYAPKIWDVQV